MIKHLIGRRRSRPLVGFLNRTPTAHGRLTPSNKKRLIEIPEGASISLKIVSTSHGGRHTATSGFSRSVNLVMLFTLAALRGSALLRSVLLRSALLRATVLPGSALLGATTILAATALFGSTLLGATTILAATALFASTLLRVAVL